MPPRPGLRAPAAGDLPVQLVATALLRHDPANPRRHGEQNRAAIRASLAEFGQRKPLVVTPDHTVIAGNGTLEVIRDELGWETVWVTVFPGTAEQARAFGLADNRAADLAEWDPALLRAALTGLPEDLAAAAGYGLAELAAALQDTSVLQHSADYASPADPEHYAEQYAVILPVDTEQDQMSLLARLTAAGYHCKAITT